MKSKKPWKNIKKMFPTGKVDYLNIPIEDVIKQQSDIVSFPEIRMARDMMIEQNRLEWTSTGEFNRYKNYSVYGPKESPDGTPALNVYGAKMIKEFLWRKENIPNYRPTPFVKNYLNTLMAQQQIEEKEILSPILNLNNQVSEDKNNDNDGFNYTGL